MISYQQQAEMLLKRALQSVKNGTPFSVQGDQVRINVVQIEQLKKIRPYAQVEVDSALEQITAAVQNSTHLRSANARIAANRNADTLPKAAAAIKESAAAKNAWVKKPAILRFAIRTGRILRWLFWDSPRWFKIIAIIVIAILWAIFQFNWITSPFASEAVNPASVQAAMVAQPLYPPFDNTVPTAPTTTTCWVITDTEGATARVKPDKTSDKAGDGIVDFDNGKTVIKIGDTVESNQVGSTNLRGQLEEAVLGIPAQAWIHLSAAKQVPCP